MGSLNGGGRRTRRPVVPEPGLVPTRASRGRTETLARRAKRKRLTPTRKLTSSLRLSIGSSSPAGHAPNRRSSSSASTSCPEPPTYVESRSTSVATHQARAESIGQADRAARAGQEARGRQGSREATGADWIALEVVAGTRGWSSGLRQTGSRRARAVARRSGPSARDALRRCGCGRSTATRPRSRLGPCGRRST